MEINCDLGENLEFLENGLDEAFMQEVDAINIACTYHAGSEYIILKTLENALKYDVQIGFHPSYNDFENFGRIDYELKTFEIKDLIFEQWQIISNVAFKIGAEIRHIKPHGALYNRAAKDQTYAKAIAEAVFEINPNLILYGLSGSFSILEAQKIGLRIKNEVFADRAYGTTGALISRNVIGAVHSDIHKIEAQARAFYQGKAIESNDGNTLFLKADTICVHSDTLGGLEIVRLIKKIRNEEK
jgi:5-oxoprolinase (ATP-hydrolysing) subunit A